MKKSIKRTLSLLLALTMVLSLGLPAYAVGAPAEDEVVISEEPIALPEQEPVEEPVEKPVTLPIGAGKKIDFTEEEEIISDDLIVDFSDVEDELVVETEAAPAKNFVYSESATGFTVEVSAPAGALPLGTEMFVDRLVDLSAVQAAVDNAEDLNGSVQLAADISFWLEGKEIEPAEGAKLVVRMSAPEIETIAAPVIVHIPDGENAVPEIVEQLSSGDVMMADTVSFEAASFSIYAIVSDDVVVTPRTTYHFLSEVQADGTAEPYYFVNKAGDTVDYQIMKDDEKLEDPGHPVTGLEKNFLGWFIVEKNGDTYTFPEGGQKIDFSLPHPEKATVSTGDRDVYVAARFGQAFIVTFWDNAKGSPADQMHIVAKKVVYLDEGKTYAEVRVDDVTAPSAATHVHSAWTSDDYKAGTQTTFTLNDKPVWDEVTNSFNLYPIFSEGHWLRFSGGPAGSGAGYRSAIFVTANTTAAEITNLGTVAREGYTFAGWFYKGSDENPFDGTEAATNASGNALNAADLLSRVQNADGDTTLYAHWTGNQVKYKVVTWFENADDDKYAFGAITEPTGTAGTTSNVTASAVTGFTAQAIEQKEIKGDGTTVVNVYYKRNVYNIYFHSSRRNSQNNIISNLTITAKYGQDIHDQWPSYKGESAAWYVATTGYTFVIQCTTMPLNGGNYYRYSSGDTYVQDVFRVQSVNGGNNFDDYNIARYTGSRDTYNTAEDYTAIKGFKLNAASANEAREIREAGGDPDATYDSRFERSDPIGTTYRNSGHTINNTPSVLFYYLRNTYDVEFLTHVSGAPAVTADFTNIYYEANIAQVKSAQITALNQQYKPGETTVEVTGEGTYVFKGWYQNAEGMGDPFDFNTKMPVGGIVLHAVWEKVWYLVQIDPRGGEIKPDVNESTYTWLQYGQTLNQYNIRRDFVEANDEYTGDKYYYVNVLALDDPHNVDESQYIEEAYRNEDGYIKSTYRKGFYIKTTDVDNDAYKFYKDHGYIDTTVKYMPATTNDNYAFVGWYKATVDPETHQTTDTNEVYDFSSLITGETAIYAKWRRSGLFSVQYHTENGTVKGTITGFGLVATDPSYADQSTTQIAYTPTSITSTDGKTYVFKGWQPVDPHGFDAENPGSATPLGTKLYVQGDNFLVEADNADSGHYIHLVAVYEPAETNPDTLPVTTVSFNPNFPAGATNTSGEAKTVEGVPLNTAIDLSKTSFTIVTEGDDRVETIPQFSCFGYTQIGWNTQPDGSGQPFKMTDIVGVDDLDRTSTNTKANVLYAIWGPAYFYVYQSSNNKVTRVSMATMTADSVYDLTQHVVKTDYLYGGYYRDYAGKSDGFDPASLTYNNDVATDNGTNAKGYTGKNVTWNLDDAYKPGDEDFTGAGNAIKPVANAVYYIKEVPGANYLKHMMKFTYKTVTGKIGTAWLVTNADDANYDDIGFEITGKGKVGNNVGVKAEKMYIRAANTDTTKAYKVSDEIADDKFTSLFGQYGKLMSYKLVYNDPTAGTDNAVAPLPGVNPLNDLTAGSVVRNYWVTLDGLKVTSTMVRTYNQVENTYSGERPTTVPYEAGSQIMKPDKTSA